MRIRLYRNGSRALILPYASSLDDCEAQLWLGQAASSEEGNLEGTTPMMELDVAQVLKQVRARGYCAIDSTGIVDFEHARAL